MKKSILSILVARVALAASAQNYSVDWYKISGGGGMSSGGPVTGSNYFSVSGTIGQPDASANNALTGGNFSLTGGFWSLYAVQTTGFPTLAIRSAAPNSAVVFWQNVGSYTLQTNSHLATTNWVDLRRQRRARQRHEQRHVRTRRGQFVLPAAAVKLNYPGNTPFGVLSVSTPDGIVIAS